MPPSPSREASLHRPATPPTAKVPGRRLFTDSRGVEWEVLDEASPHMALLMEADVQLHPDSAGLIFNSRAGYRRLHPRPGDWERMTDPQLEALCDRARSIL